jgi:hypothetical protein
MNVKISRNQLSRIIQEQVEPSSPELQVILDQMENLSIDEIRAIWRAAAGITKQKQNELKAGLKKGTLVAWTHTTTGKEVTGTVMRRGAKYVMVTADDDPRPRKKWPSSLRVIE